MTDSYYGNIRNPKENKQTNKYTHTKLGFYGIPGSVIHLTKKRLNYQTMKISLTVTGTITEAWIQIEIIYMKKCNDALYWNGEA